MTKKKILMLASVASTIKQFNMNNITLLREMGYDVDIACNFDSGSNISDEEVKQFRNDMETQGIRCFHIDFDRNALNIKQDIIAVKQVKRLVKEEKYYAIHCHTPIGGVAGRMAGRSEKCKVIYTAHGFHFFKGAPLKNWLLFYPVEKFLSRYTDMLITMNEEDRTRAENTFHAKEYGFIHGVGVDTSMYECERKEREGNVILSVGELNENKNHETVIRALAMLKDEKWEYLICGKGKKESELAELAKSLEIGERVHILGYRDDVKEIMKDASIFVFPSFREGLSVALMEAMASGLPVVASNIRGNRDLIQNEEGGFLVSAGREEEYVAALRELLSDADLRRKLGMFNRNTVKNYDSIAVNDEMRLIYSKVLRNEKNE